MELFKYYMIIYVYTINLYMLCNVSPAHTHTPGPQLVLDTLDGDVAMKLWAGNKRQQINA